MSQRLKSVFDAVDASESVVASESETEVVFDAVDVIESSVDSESETEVCL